MRLGRHFGRKQPNRRAVRGSAPGAPSLTATAGNGQVTLAWTDSGATATSHNLYQGTASGSLSLVGPIGSSPYVVTGLTNGTPYYFKVSATNLEGESALSTEQSATPADAGSTPAGALTFSDNDPLTFSDANYLELAA